MNRKHSFEQTFGPSQKYRSNNIGEVLISLATASVEEAMSEADDYMRRKSVGLTRSLREAERAFADKKYVDCIYFIKEVNEINKTSHDNIAITYNSAINAQKEITTQSYDNLILSINKSEESTHKQLEQQRSVLASVEHTLSEKISDVANRMTRFESTGAGRTSITGPIGVVVGAVLTSIIIAALLAFVKNDGNNNSLSSRLSTLEAIESRQQLKSN